MTSENIIKFEKFMRERRVKGKHSHTFMGPPYGAYMIEDKDYKKFIKLYTRCSKEKDLYIVERPKEIGQLLIDIDMRFKTEERKYDKNTIKYLIKEINRTVEEYYRIEKDELETYVLEKERATYDNKNKEYKDGFHIMYPKLLINSSMRYHIIEKTRERIEDSENEITKLEFKNDIRDVFDTCVVKSNGWIMYGSKKYGGYKYEITKVYNKNIEEQDKPKYSSRTIYLLGNRKEAKENTNYKIGEKKIEEIKERYMNKSKNKSRMNNKNNENKKNKIDKNKIDKNKKKDKSKRLTSEQKKNIDDAKKLIKIISKKRAESYQDWIQVCWALRSTKGELMEEWKEFSRQCPEKYDENTCEELWYRAKDEGEGYTIASLHFWAKKDNPKGYNKFIKENINELIKKAENGTETQIAKVVYEIKKHEFVCTEIKRNKWYQFINHRWKEIEDGYTLDKYLSDGLTNEFALLNSQYYQIMSTLEDADEKERLLKKINNIQKIILNLNRPSFKSGIMKECSKLFIDEEFIEKLDTNVDLIGFENGIYDLKNGIFREGLPDDYVTLSTKQKYKELDENDKHVKWVENFFSKVQTDKEMNEYIKSFFASCLDGRVSSEKFYIWTGSGSNGKSKSVELFKNTAGQYCGTIDIKLLTGKRPSSNAAKPELAPMRNKRFVVFQEPEKNENVNVGYMKQLTGGDVITARNLYEKEIEFKPQFTLVLTCNDLPQIPSNDNGTWRRLRVSPWESKFVDYNKKTGKKINENNGKECPLGNNEFPKDNKLNEKLSNKYILRAFIWLLLNKYYPKYKNNDYSIREPKKVTKFTNNYQKDNDFYSQFINENLIKSTNNCVQISEVYNSFVSWFRQENSDSKCPSRNELKKYFKDNKYDIDKKKLKGYKLCDEEDDEDNEDEDDTN